ncbi:uncharacterized protein LOC143266414 [Megachile rotundata]|uniref:uncharacterized protein LOC143266414 n=1 Tax=Megachile rotundata TaxID=143995 RepID=UPI003FCF362C
MVKIFRQRVVRDTSPLSGSGSGTLHVGSPIRKCPGVSADKSEGSSESGCNGLEFTHASIWQRSVDISSKAPEVRRVGGNEFPVRPVCCEQSGGLFVEFRRAAEHGSQFPVRAMENGAIVAPHGGTAASSPHKSSESRDKRC